ncbi:MAG: glycosyltransferase [Planctomycetota bacterium]
MRSGGLKVLHVSYTAQAGGAAIAMHRLHSALGKIGVQSEILAIHTGEPEDPTILKAFSGAGLFWARVAARLGALSSRLRADPDSHGCSVNVLPNGMAAAIAKHSPDVVHLHWVGANTLAIRDLRRIVSPMVWTLHDMWPFCGAEHYSFSDRWQTGYLQKQKKPSPQWLDVDALTYRLKRRAWRGVSIDTVAPSTWMRDCAASAALWRGSECVRHHVIGNGLPLDVFVPQDQTACRARFEIPQNATVILFGAQYCEDRIKGGDLLAAALPAVKLPDQNICAVTFGAGPATPSNTSGGVSRIHLGTINDSARLAQVYNCADIMVVPSRIESFCQTASEAQACGVPVVCFDATGLRDVVDHEVTGYRAQPYDPMGIAHGIEWCLLNRGRHGSLKTAARARAEQLFSDSMMARCYAKLYAQILDRRPCPR